MIKKIPDDSDQGVGFLKFIASFLFNIFLITSPLMLVIGLPGILTGGWPVWLGIVVSIAGLVILILTIAYSVVKDKIRREEGGRFITKTNLATIAFVGFSEIIVSIPLIYEIGIDFAVGFLFLGAGCLTFLPAAIFLLVLIFQERKK